MFLALLALLLAWAGSVLLLLGRIRDPAILSRREAVASPSLRHSRSGWVLLSGLALWALAFLQMPWATANCPSPLFFGGTCSGLTATGTLRYAIAGYATLPWPWTTGALFVGVDPFAALYAFPLLLTSGALLIAGALWRRAPMRFVAVTMAVWLLVTAGAALLALLGEQMVLANPTAEGLPGGAWQGGMGSYMTALALALVLAGLGTRLLAPVFRRMWTGPA
jgi:putative solute:sodium symporter small subunit